MNYIVHERCGTTRAYPMRESIINNNNNKRKKNTTKYKRYLFHKHHHIKNNNNNIILIKKTKSVRSCSFANILTCIILLLYDI